MGELFVWCVGYGASKHAILLARRVVSFLLALSIILLNRKPSLVQCLCSLQEILTGITRAHVSILITKFLSNMQQKYK